MRPSIQIEMREPLNSQNSVPSAPSAPSTPQANLAGRRVDRLERHDGINYTWPLVFAVVNCVVGGSIWIGCAPSGNCSEGTLSFGRGEFIGGSIGLNALAILHLYFKYCLRFDD